MWLRFLVASGLILLIALAWVGIQQAYRRFTLRHPEWGPLKELFGCRGLTCTCEEPCEKQKKRTNRPPRMK